MELGNAPLLEMKNIKKDFFGNQVLTDINLTLQSGQVLGLCGENGAGKSTLMKILFGMDVIRETGGYEGDILLNGEKVEFNTPFDALEAGIGMVHQEFSLIPGFTATENILLNRESQNRRLLSEIFGERLNTLDFADMKVITGQSPAKSYLLQFVKTFIPTVIIEVLLLLAFRLPIKKYIVPVLIVNFVTQLCLAAVLV